MIRELLIGGPLALAAAAAFASPLFVNFDSFNYSGTVSRYATLADAQAGTNAISTTAIATATNDTRSTLPNARDGNLYVASGAAGYDPVNLAQFSTAWYFTTFPANVNGWGNPNNTNPGFVQYYDLSANPVVTGGWSNANTRFTVNIAGGDGDSGNFARLWAAPGGGGQGGLFREFQLSLVADFAAAATLDAGTGWYEADTDPTAFTGGATGIFENQSADTAQNGFYSFSLSFAPGSWAVANGATWDNGQFAPEAFFAAPGAAAVPEPGSLALAAAALLGAGLVRRRRR